MSYNFFKRNLNEGGYDWLETEFHETVEMSSYLVALVISDFVCINSTAIRKIERFDHTRNKIICE